MQPKKLNLEEMWKLYLLLKPALDEREREEILIDEVEKILTLSKQGTLFECLPILYDNIDTIEPGKEYIILFMQGLIDNSFFDFIDFTKVFKK